MFLIINSGSATLKFKIFNKNLREIKSGIVERIGLKDSFLLFNGGKKIIFKKGVKNHETAFEIVLAALKKSRFDLRKIQTVGHRIVHGGEEFSRPTLITPKVLRRLEKYSSLAPLHNPANLAGIRASFKFLPKIKNIGVFDTGFFSTLPPESFIYPLPYKFYKKYKIRKYGFHGISHQYVSEEAAKILKKFPTGLKLITCHLGSGASLAAIKFGKAVETSMGFTPLQGLMMSTRSGDIDPSLPLYFIEKFKMTPGEVSQILNYKSGLLGISGFKDMRDVLVAAGFKIQGYKGPTKVSASQRKRAKLALAMFVYNVQRYIGMYYVLLGGADAIVFTAGIGERSPAVRQLIIKDLEFLNKFKKIKVLVIPTNEELMIAREVAKLTKLPARQLP